jgi:hypothetical protein
MSSIQPYNSLGQILASGGEIAVAFALIRGVDIEAALSRLKVRFAPIQDDTWESILSLSRNAIDAAVRWGAMPRDETPDADIIPVNPHLFGDDWRGKRVRIITSSQDRHSGQKIDMWWEFPDMFPLQDLYNEIADRIEEMEQDTPQLQRWITKMSDDGDWNHELIIAERRY